MIVVRCSGLARPMTCAGSLFFKDLPPQEESEAARQGTAFGQMMERMLLGKPIGTHADNGYPFDNEMEFYAKPLFEEIKGRAQSEIRCEQRVDWVPCPGVEIKGSYDVSYVSEGRLYIDDFKYGWGIVEVYENWQLLGYAIGEVIRRQMMFDEIVMRIHQPRPHHEDGSTREWRITYAQLLGYQEKIRERMTAIAGGDNTLVTSPKCKYCPAAAVCPAVSKAFYRGLEIVHEFIQDNMDEKELSHQLDIINRFEELMKIRKDSLKALAVDRLKNGKVIPGYIAESSYGDRKWKAGITPEVIKTMTKKDVMISEMLSPAQAEKIGIPKAFVNALVDRQFLGQKLVKKDSSILGEKIFGTQK